MATSLKFYTTAGLTAELTQLAVNQAADGSSAAVDSIVYLGSTASGKQFRADSDPGTDPIVVSIADAAAGSGIANTAVKLALSAGGLDSAVAGVALSVGTQLLSGSANALAIHVRIETPSVAVGRYTDLSLVTNTVREEAV